MPLSTLLVFTALSAQGSLPLAPVGLDLLVLLRSLQQAHDSTPLRKRLLPVFNYKFFSTLLHKNVRVELGLGRVGVGAGTRVVWSWRCDYN